jgi:hypothetical protein
MTEQQNNMIAPILSTIVNEDIREFAIALLDSLPEYIWVVPASSTGKYHPEYSLGEGGLMRHQIAVVRFLNFFFELEQYSSKLTSREMDLMRVAGLTHDSMKSGSQEQFDNNKYTKFEHPLMMATKVREFNGYIQQKELDFIADAISKHMGGWNTDKKSDVVLPKPNDKFSRMLHVADYLSSRKSLTMNFDESMFPAPKVVEFDPNWVMPFGKYKGETLKSIYDIEPGYLDWAERSVRKQEVVQMIKAFRKTIE